MSSPTINNLVLKTGWERSQAPVIIDIPTAQALLTPYTKNDIKDLVLLSDGCANNNYKITFKQSNPPIVLRIYLRDPSALPREIKLRSLLAHKIPMPAYFYSNTNGEIIPYPYAITEYIAGRTMRDVILTHDETAIAECTFAAGKYLTALHDIHFTVAGFLQEDLTVRPFTQEEHYLHYVLSLLADPTVIQTLDAALLKATKQLVINNSTLLNEHDPANLTHGDYDPSNMLVNQQNGQWQITAILDWEFAFAGSYLLDIGLMLRYSHRLPTCYEQNFIAGFKTLGQPLPPTWKQQAKLWDLLCLLQFLQSHSMQERPRMRQDVVSLIVDINKDWDFY